MKKILITVLVIVAIITVGFVIWVSSFVDEPNKYKAPPVGFPQDNSRS